MTKEAKQFRIVGKKDDYKAIGDKLAPEYQQHFFEQLGQREFSDVQKAVGEDGETIAECLDPERLKRFLKMNGYKEKVVYQKHKKKKKK